jgi:putative intracellular protease/amidase
MKLFLILSFMIPLALYSQSKTNKIVMVVSSYGKDLGKTRPGYEMDEFSQAYHIFKTNGLHIDVASPRGGSVEPSRFNKEKPYNKALIEDNEAMMLLQSTKSTATLKATNYDAIYIVGGKGPMFDLVVDPSLQDLISEMNDQGKIISAVCHGTIALANIKKDTSYLVVNRLLTGFCNEEETMFGKTSAEFPFLLEDRLIQRGANYQKGEAMLPFMVRDRNMITGQNPYSTTAVAEEIVRSLGKELVKRKKYKDEMSMELINKFLQGEVVWAKQALNSDREEYDLELIAVFGYYQAMFAKDDIMKIKKGISIVELVTPYYHNEDLYIKLADYYLKVNDRPKAIQTLNSVIEKNQNSKAANTLLKKILE